MDRGYHAALAGFDNLTTALPQGCVWFVDNPVTIGNYWINLEVCNAAQKP
jgi:hypothetical protein